jgi:hypothetical protein
MTRKRWAIVVCWSAAATGAGVLLVLAGDGQDGFWARNPMFGAIASGVFLLLFGAFVFNEVIEHRELNRWREVAEMACHVLGDQLSRGILLGITALYAAEARERGVWEVRPGWKTSDLEPLAEAVSPPPGRERIEALAGSLPPAEHDPEDLLPRPRLTARMADVEWMEWAIADLRARRARGRDLVSQWAAVMIAAKEPRALMSACAYLNEEVGYLRQSMERSLQADLDEAEDAGAWIDDCLRRWQLLDGRARILTNHLWAAAGEAHYSFRLPPQLANATLEEAFSDARSIGEWAPAEGAHPDTLDRKAPFQS